MTTTLLIEVSVTPSPGATGPASSNPLDFTYAGTSLPNGDIDLTTIKDDVVLEFELVTPEVVFGSTRREVRLSRGSGHPNTLWIWPVGQGKGKTSPYSFQFLDFRQPAQKPRAIAVTAANSKKGIYNYGIEVELATGDAADPWRPVRHDPQIRNGGNPNILNPASIRVMQIVVAGCLVLPTLGFALHRLMP